jgi:hypothetical protein
MNSTSKPVSISSLPLSCTARMTWQAQRHDKTLKYKKANPHWVPQSLLWNVITMNKQEDVGPADMWFNATPGEPPGLVEPGIAGGGGAARENSLGHRRYLPQSVEGLQQTKHVEGEPQMTPNTPDGQHGVHNAVRHG